MSPLPPARPDLSRLSFLIVEDFEGMRGILRDMLNHAGATRITFAVDAASALSLLERQYYDAVLCDLHLGRGRDGQQLLEEARQRLLLAPHTVWLMVSAEKTAEMVTGTVESRPDDYLIKPLTQTLLYTRLARQIAKKQALAPIEQAMRDGELLKALRLTETALEHAHSHAWELKRLKAELAMQTGNAAQAREIFAEALAQRDLPWAHLGLAKIDYHEGQHSAARKRLEQITDGNRAYLEAHDWLARALERLGDLDGAQAVLQRALATSPRAPLRQARLGDVAFRRGEHELAAVALRHSIELARGTPLRAVDPYLALARVNLARDNKEGALDALKGLDGEFRDHDEARLLARAMEIPVHAHFDETPLAWALAHELAPALKASAASLPAEAIFDIAAPLLELGDHDTAAALLGGVLGNHHEHPEYIARTQQLYAKAGMAEAGQQLVGRATREALEIMDQGVQLFHAGRLDDAVRLTREARARMPGNARLLLNHAFLLIAHMEHHGRDAKLIAEARECIAIARRLKPEEKRAGELLTRMELVSNDFVIPASVS